MSDLSLGNVINISISDVGQGIGEFNTSNLAIFSKETPNASFGTDGYKIYLESSEVEKDWGTASKTYKQALAAFTPEINIKSNGGYLVIFEMLKDIPAVVGVTAKYAIDVFVADEGSYKIQIGALTTAAIDFDADAAAIQAALIAAGMAGATCALGGGKFNIDTGIQAPQSSFSIVDNTLEQANVAVVPVMTLVAAGVVPVAQHDESYIEAYSRTKGQVQYFGILLNSVIAKVEALALAQYNQVEDKILFLVFNTADAIAADEICNMIRESGLDQTRCLYYEQSEVEALRMASTYAGRFLSTIFEGSNTTSTMHLKDLDGMLADSNMNQSKLELCKICGADFYGSFRGVAKTYTSGANNFADQVYNRLWIKGAMEVALFNILAQTQTKIPQTEEGMNVYKQGLVDKLEIGKVNGYIAAGKWTRPDSFGPRADFLRNISEQGYFVWSLPIIQQSAAARDNREAPLVQVAFKEAGAIHKGNVIVNINK